MKKFILLLSIFLLTGCGVQYNLTINKETIDENITLSIDEQSIDERMISELTYERNSPYLNSKEYYEINSYNNGSISNYNYKFSHKINDFANDKLLKWCYQNVEIKNDFAQFSINTSDIFICARQESQNKLDYAQINITTDLKVVSNNADEVNGKTYTWNITKDNYLNKPIKINIEKSYQISDTGDYVKHVIKNEASKEMLIICSLIVLTAICIFLFIKHKSARNNKI